MIQEVVSERRMPPWHADPKHGKFANDRSLSQEERETLLAWIEQGCPRATTRTCRRRGSSPTSWMIGKPDAVFTMPSDFNVPAKAAKGRPLPVFHGADQLQGRHVGPGGRGQAGQPRGRASHHRLRVQAGGKRGQPAETASATASSSPTPPATCRPSFRPARPRRSPRERRSSSRCTTRPTASAEPSFVGRSDLRQGDAEARGPSAIAQQFS